MRPYASDALGAAGGVHPFATLEDEYVAKLVMLVSAVASKQKRGLGRSYHSW